MSLTRDDLDRDDRIAALEAAMIDLLREQQVKLESIESLRRQLAHEVLSARGLLGKLVQDDARAAKRFAKAKSYAINRAAAGSAGNTRDGLISNAVVKGQANGC